MNATLGVKDVLKAVAAGVRFSPEEAARAVDLLTGEGSTPQKSAFLMGLRVRGEAVGEIVGAARAMRQKMTTVAAPADAIDIVGTGGDGHGTFNVSTASAIVAAGAGLRVAKHGNRSVSSLSGASDVLAALGVKLDCGPALIERAIQEAGVGFLWAPAHHPAFKAWAEARAELGVRTMFNIMGPICNPANVKRHVIGVFAPEWVAPIAEVLRALGSDRAWVVHGHDGLDELSTTGPTTVASLDAGEITTFEITPQDAGLTRASLADLKGGDGAHNAAALNALLAGAKGPYRDIVLLNTAAALIVAGKAKSLGEGAGLAADAIDSGRAAEALASLVAVSHSAGAER